MPTIAHCIAWMTPRWRRMASPRAARAARNPPARGVSVRYRARASSTVGMSGVLARHQYGLGLGVEVVEEVVLAGRQATEHQAGADAGSQHLLLVQRYALE